MPQFNFDARNIKPREAFEPIPAGWYHARIVSSEIKPTKNNDGFYLQFELEIIDGEYQGRKVFDRMNKWAGVDPQTGAEDPAKAQTREIADRQISAYCHATGVHLFQASEQLHGIPLKIRVSVRQDPGYDAANDIKAVKHIQEATPSSPQAAVGPMSAFAPSSPAAAPTPFGMNPSLPAQPAPGQQAPFTPPAAPSAPAAAPASSTPWGSPAQQTPFGAPPAGFAPAQAPAAAPLWGPPAGPTSPPAAAGASVPPWRK